MVQTDFTSVVCGANHRHSYHFFIKEYSNILALTQNRWSLQCTSILTGITVLLTQGFYLRRVSISMAQLKSRYRPWFLGIMGTLLLCELGVVVTISVKTFTSSDALQSSSSTQYFNSILLGVALAIDCALTGALVIILRCQRTQFRSTNGVLNALALYAVIATALNTPIISFGFR
ncbi:hypothetical protein C8Q76DRAFT_706970 [Earliella scabrosa]|nr:hypothetical protein C8Q76DRAFT_706970 [Earliella scabrosa]